MLTVFLTLYHISKNNVYFISHCISSVLCCVDVQYMWNECGNGIEAESRKASGLELTLPVPKDSLKHALNGSHPHHTSSSLPGQDGAITGIYIIARGSVQGGMGSC